MFSRCTKWLIMCRFEQDMPPPDPFGRYPKDRAACALCKTKRTRAQMEGRRSGRSGVSFPICGPCRLFQFPEKRYCAKHPLFITWVKPSSVQPETPWWVMTPRLTCMHCTAHVTSADTRSTGCENCKCDVCPRTTKCLFIRYGRLPKAARAGRPYIDELISFDDRQTYYEGMNVVHSGEIRAFWRILKIIISSRCYVICLIRLTVKPWHYLPFCISST